METIAGLKEKWMQLSGKYTDDLQLQNTIIDKVIAAYSETGRHYHTLSHIQKMFDVTSSFEEKLSDRDAVLFAIWFHDAVYDAKKTDNEEKSAELAKSELTKFTNNKDLINKVVELILHTKNHSTLYKDESKDMQLFLDTDLVILGSNRNEYSNYMQGVRKEYRHVPELLYKVGRKKILKKFLEQEFIYRSPEFRNQFEKTARENIQFEIDQL